MRRFDCVMVYNDNINALKQSTMFVFRSVLFYNGLANTRSGHELLASANNIVFTNGLFPFFFYFFHARYMWMFAHRHDDSYTGWKDPNDNALPFNNYCSIIWNYIRSLFVHILNISMDLIEKNKNVNSVFCTMSVCLWWCRNYL